MVPHQEHNLPQIESYVLRSHTLKILTLVKSVTILTSFFAQMQNMALIGRGLFETFNTKFQKNVARFDFDCHPFDKEG